MTTVAPISGESLEVVSIFTLSVFKAPSIRAQPGRFFGVCCNDWFGSYSLNVSNVQTVTPVLPLIAMVKDMMAYS
jgi:hypothetical protein